MRVFATALVLPLILVFCGTMPHPALPQEANASAAAPVPWAVEELRPGMQGVGRTVMQGTEIIEFNAVVIGIQRNVSPGRDLVLMRLSGADLERTGVIAGMSGSPVYIDGRLVGAVAYAWQFGIEPIAGVTPFVQMRDLSEPPVRAVVDPVAGPEGDSPPPSRGLSPSPGEEESPEVDTSAEETSLLLFGVDSELRLAAELPRPRPLMQAPGDAMLPIGLPVSATGFSPRALGRLQESLEPFGMIPVQGGAAAQYVYADLPAEPIVPGAPLAVSLVTGDFDLTGIGTVTHVEGDRVYGWGHPFMSLGRCELPLRSGYIHTVYPRQNLSMKMGSGLETVGTITADVSTCVAGRLGVMPDMVPVTVTVQHGASGTPQTFHCQVVREPTLLGSLVATILNGSIDAEGNVPADVTIEFEATVRPAGFEPITVRDMYSGNLYSGMPGSEAVFNQVAAIVNILSRNVFDPVRIESVECRTTVLPGRRSASIESIRLHDDELEPGETLAADVTLQPFRGPAETVQVELAIPERLPPGNYELTVCDFGTHMQRLLAEQSHLLAPQNVSQVVRALHAQVAEQHNVIYLRVVLPETGVALEGVALPSLPASARAVFSDGRRTEPPTVRRSLVARHETDWVIEGAQQLRFRVVAPTPE